jgi:NAD(P)-dependent dehydrogenase (short-subunit alcohol dehydrogenase family)
VAAGARHALFGLTRTRAPPQRDEVTKLFSETVAKYGKVDILVNNAGAAHSGVQAAHPGPACAHALSPAAQASPAIRC